MLSRCSVRATTSIAPGEVVDREGLDWSRGGDPVRHLQLSPVDRLCPGRSARQRDADDARAATDPCRPPIGGRLVGAADPRVEREPLDDLKYIPLVPTDPKIYLSFGVNVRERFVLDHATFFGTPPGESGEWILSRLEWHADFRLGKHLQVFAQFTNALAPGKEKRLAVDQDRLDVEQAFIGFTEPFAGGTLRMRLERDVLPFELQRFVSVREGPNLRQSYDAAFADFERGRWRVSGAYTQPVQIRDEHAFDDYSNHHLTFSGGRVQYRWSGSSQLSVSYSNYRQDDAVFASVRGNERRNALDIRTSGTVNGF